VASSQDSLFASLPALEPDSQPEPIAASPSTPPPPPLSPQPNQLAHVSHWPSLSLSLSSSAGEEFVRAELAPLDAEPDESDEDVVSHISISISSDSDQDERSRQAEVRQSPHLQSLLVLHYSDAENAVRDDINRLHTESANYIRHLEQAVTRLEQLQQRSTAIRGLIGPAAIRQVIAPAAQREEEEHKHVQPPVAAAQFPASSQPLASEPAHLIASSAAPSAPSLLPATSAPSLDNNEHDDRVSDEDDDMPNEPSQYTVGPEWYNQKDGLHMLAINEGKLWFNIMELKVVLVKNPNFKKSGVSGKEEDEFKEITLSRQQSFDVCRKKWKVISDAVYAKVHIRISSLSIKFYAVLPHSTAAHSHTPATRWELARHTLANY